MRTSVANKKVALSALGEQMQIIQDANATRARNPRFYFVHAITKPRFLTKMRHQKSGIPCSECNYVGSKMQKQIQDKRKNAIFCAFWTQHSCCCILVLSTFVHRGLKVRLFCSPKWQQHVIVICVGFYGMLLSFVTTLQQDSKDSRNHRTESPIFDAHFWSETGFRARMNEIKIGDSVLWQQHADPEIPDLKMLIRA